MAGLGPTPKAQHQRERDTRRRQADTVTVTDDGVLRGPDFPFDLIPTPHPATLEWWQTWRESPQASLFLPTDWQTLKRAAGLQDAVSRASLTPKGPSAAAISELRLIEERLGATYVDRLRAKIRVGEAGEDARVTPIRAVPKADTMARLQAAPEPEEAPDEPDF